MDLDESGAQRSYAGLVRVINSLTHNRACKATHMEARSPSGLGRCGGDIRPHISRRSHFKGRRPSLLLVALAVPQSSLWELPLGISN